MLTPGSSILLFEGPFPFNFEEDELPQSLGAGVLLAATPWEVLEAAGPASLRSFVLPSYEVLAARANACLALAAEVTPPTQCTRRDLLFNALRALRLHAPIGLQVAGSFTIGEAPTLLEDATLYNFATAWQPDSSAEYTAADLRAVARLAETCLRVGEAGGSHIASALVLFGHATCGFSRSLHLSYLGLFAALESLYWPKNKLAPSLAERASRFLAPFASPERVQPWLQEEYEMGRNKLAHGAASLSPWPAHPSSRATGFGRLHEITRLSLLGFLSRSEEEIRQLHARGQHLDGLGVAAGSFIDGQRMRLGDDPWLDALV